jgi:polar amino acid transport system substrate-binding protein
MKATSHARWRADLATIAGVIALFAVLNLLPSDTALSELRRAGILRVCVPTLYPPLVTGRPDAPGYDIEFAQAIAARLDVRLLFNANPAMGRDFNPRNWNVTRAQCEIAGRRRHRLRTHAFVP